MFRSIHKSFGLLTSSEKFAIVAFTAMRVILNLLDLIGLAGIGFLGTILIGAVSGTASASLGDFEITIDDKNELVVAVLIIAIFFVAKSILSTIALRMTSRYLAKVEARRSEAIAQYLFSGGLERVRSFSPGELQFAVGQATHAAFSLLLYAGTAVVAEAALFLVIITGLAVLDPLTTLFATIYFVLLVVIFQLGVNSRLLRIGTRLQKSQVSITNVIFDLRNAFRELSILERRELLLGKFYANRFRHAQDQGLQKFVAQLPRFFVEAGLMIGIVGLVVMQILSGNVAEGAVTTGIFLAGGVRIMAALLPLQTAIADIKYAAPQAEKAHILLKEIRNLNGLLPVAARAPRTYVSSGTSSPLSVSGTDVSFTYADGHEKVLHGVNFDVEPGKFVAFIGPSGSGKTTLIDLILGLLEPDKGKILINGQDPKIFRRAYPGAISYVPQRPGMVSGTLAQNVALGVDDIDISEEKVNEALAIAELSDLVASLPLGIHQSLGSNADSLSGGQLQRLGLARAMYSDPKLLILDEATSALDASTEADVIANVEAIGNRATRVVIAHRLSTIQRADYVYVIDSGEIVAEGTFPQVRRQSRLVENYIKLMEIGTRD